MKEDLIHANGNADAQSEKSGKLRFLARLATFNAVSYFAIGIAIAVGGVSLPTFLVGAVFLLMSLAQALQAAVWRKGDRTDDAKSKVSA